MYLTKEEERMLDGSYGNVVARCMKLLVKLGEKFNAERMVKIGSAQIAGVSYKNIGDPGLEFLEGFAKEGARVKVPAFMNPAGMPFNGWKELGFSEEFAEKQTRIVEAFRAMGVVIISTCTPYLAGLLPRYREHIAWSESSAVAFANSVIGARTNREGGPSALAAAITGRTPMYGLHLEENRSPTFLVEVKAKLRDIADFGALGYIVGKVMGKGIPYFKGMSTSSCDEDTLKALGASLAAYGAVALFHIEGITPEAGNASKNLKDVEDKLKVDNDDIRVAYDEMCSAVDNVDVIAVGCPHASIAEIQNLISILNGKRSRVPIWVFTSEAVKRIAERAGYLEKLEKLNVKIIADTCPVVAPLEELGIKKMAVNSAKAAFYLPNTNSQVVFYDKLENIIKRFC